MFCSQTIAQDFPSVVPGYALEFPRDEGSHPHYRTEWWYVTGWLQDQRGSALGFQVTFFRTRPSTDEQNPSRFAPKQILFAHAALSDPAIGALIHDQRAARAGFELAEAREGSTQVFIDDWSLSQQGESYRARIPAQGFTLDLNFQRVQAFLLEGEAGFSRKSAAAGSASYYYSVPQLQVTGSIVRNGTPTQVHGTAWLDHEWSSSYIEPAAVGWDWIGINLQDGGALMAFRMRDAAGQPLWSAGMIRGASDDASKKTYEGKDVEWQALRSWRSLRTNTTYPVEWRVRVGERTLVLKPLMDNQESDTRQSTGTVYWEGAVTALDVEGRPMGRGYLELTGYSGKLSVGAK